MPDPAPAQEQLLPTPPLPERVPPGYDTGRCRSCNAKIIWTTMLDAMGARKTRDDGKPVRNPIDPRPRPDGNVRLTGRGHARMITAGEHVMPDERYVSHFATCPNRGRHRRKEAR